ncbi:GTP-binding protein [Actinopolymorpha alba]|uniref:GTP-binding protein n=1 Tax=Actinopolymorpha alba TaxID=533267 RepID=UPI00037D83B3|nr:GTP-binding protein [Actinopolymorpha alba]
MGERLPVTVVTSSGDVLRQVVASAVLFDVPNSVVVQHDLGHGSEPALRRVVYDVGGVVEDEVVRLEHTCLSCALREDVIPAVARLADTGRWGRIVLALPVAAEPGLVVEALPSAVVAGRRMSERVALAGVVAAVDLATLVDDLFGDDLLAERGMAHTADDRRAVGEVLAHQVEFADVVVTQGASWQDAACRETTMLRHLAPATARFGDAHEFDFASALSAVGEVPRPGVRGDYRSAEPTGATDSDAVWTLDLTTWRPLHPGRLRERIGELAAGRQRSRGRFWLPTRPGAVCCWDCAGGQLSIGTVGRWRGVPPSTRLVVTGIDDDRERLRTVFADVLMTDSELARGLDRWEGRDDGFSPWLGEADEAA